MKALKIVLALSLAINVIAIPYLIFELIGYWAFYPAHISMATEIAFAAGYHKAKDNDLKESFESFPTMLQIAAVEPNSINVNLWPRKKLVMHIDIKDEHACSTHVYKEE
jgi:hypothetical protein